MVSPFKRVEQLEAVAYWGKRTLLRREMYKALKRHPDEGARDFMDRKDEMWRQVQSADALFGQEIKMLEGEFGPVDLRLAGRND